MPPPLTPNDKKTLSLLFDPESSLSATPPISTSLPTDPHVPDSLLPSIRARELEAIRLIESLTRGPQSIDPVVRTQAYIHAEKIFTGIVEEYPRYASAWNNRAQVGRLRWGDHVLVRCQPGEGEAVAPGVEAVKQVLGDLEMAIRLASPPSPTSPASPAQARVLVSAHTQLGGLYYTASQDLARLPSPYGNGMIASEEQKTYGLTTPDLFLGWNRTRFEEEGRKHFEQAGRWGGKVGRELAVKLNPYARVCAGIVRNALREEMRGKGGFVEEEVKKIEVTKVGEKVDGAVKAEEEEGEEEVKTANPYEIEKNEDVKKMSRVGRETTPLLSLQRRTTRPRRGYLRVVIRAWRRQPLVNRIHVYLVISYALHTYYLAWKLGDRGPVKVPVLETDSTETRRQLERAGLSEVGGVNCVEAGADEMGRKWGVHQDKEMDLLDGWDSLERETLDSFERDMLAGRLRPIPLQLALRRGARWAVRT